MTHQSESPAEDWLIEQSCPMADEVLKLIADLRKPIGRGSVLPINGIKVAITDMQWHIPNEWGSPLQSTLYMTAVEVIQPPASFLTKGS